MPKTFAQYYTCCIYACSLNANRIYKHGLSRCYVRYLYICFKYQIGAGSNGKNTILKYGGGGGAKLRMHLVCFTIQYCLLVIHV